MIERPNDEYLQALIERLREKVGKQQSQTEQMVMWSGAALNWLGDFFSDENVRWSREGLAVDSLYLTGTGPDWNAIVIDRCERSPMKLREAMRSDLTVVAMFRDIAVEETPILVREDDGKRKVLDGMHRVIAAIRDGKPTLEAYVARSEGKPRPMCEPHVVYDLIRPYDRTLTTDRQGLVTALRYLRSCYANVDALLRERFTGSWIPNKEIREIVEEALQE